MTSCEICHGWSGPGAICCLYCFGFPQVIFFYHSSVLSLRLEVCDGPNEKAHFKSTVFKFGGHLWPGIGWSQSKKIKIMSAEAKIYRYTNWWRISAVPATHMTFADVFICWFILPNMYSLLWEPQISQLYLPFSTLFIQYYKLCVLTILDTRVSELN
jgi:hypothetical protein